MAVGHEAWAAEQSANTRRRLILAAMRLMAQHGIEGVSLRSVNVEAQAGNAAAAHYHFGGKKELVKALVQLLAEANAQWRKPPVDELKAHSAIETISVRDVIEATHLPFFGFYYHPDFQRYAPIFLSRLIVDPAADIRALADIFTEPIVDDAYALLGPILPQVSERVLKSRIVFSLTNLINGGSDFFSVRTKLLEDLGYEDGMDLLHHFLEYLSAGLSVPVRGMAGEFAVSCAKQLELVQSTADAKELLEYVNSGRGVLASSLLRDAKASVETEKTLNPGRNIG